MRLNILFRNKNAVTHEGAPAVAILSAEKRLRRSVLSCLLWEDQFYEDGKSIADRIVETAEAVAPEMLAAIAIEAREVFNLRHAPLLLLEVLSRTGKGSNIVADRVCRVVQRADELAELVAIHHKLGRKKMIPAQMRKGLARALAKFDEYDLAKYDRDTAVKLRDVLRLVRPTPKDAEQSALWRRAKDRELAVPDTWEVALSTGADKKETFERLLRDGKLGYLALLRNLRNMVQAGCDEALVRDAIIARKGGAHRVLPFRYVAAAKAAPQFEPAIDQALCAAIGEQRQISGKTIIIVDVSGSMYGSLVSAKSDMNRAQAASALAAIARGVFPDCRIYATAGSDAARKHATAEVPPRHGMALIDAIFGLCRPLGGGGIFLKQVIDFLERKEKTADRIIVVTDEQDCGIAPDDSPLSARPFGRVNYLINVASYRNGIGYGRWTHIDGFSEGVLRYITAMENQ
jgi:60 kDa SS-A/Ro ribonucleoprotein